MKVAIDALKELLIATEPAETEPKKKISTTIESKKDIIPEVKDNKQSKTKDRKNVRLRLMLLADKAVENALRDLKKNKLEQKVEIRYLRIAGKVVDAALVKAKENK